MEKFQFRYQTIKGLQIKPAIPEEQRTAFEEKYNAKVGVVLERFNTGAYVLALMTDEGEQLLRGLIVA